MAEELISSYIDRAAIKADTDYLLSQLKSVADAYTGLSNTKVNLSFSDSIRSTSTNLNQLNQALQQTTSSSQQAARAIETNAAAFRTEAASIDENLKLLIRNKTALDEVQSAQKLYKKQLDDGKLTLDQYTQKMSEAIKRELEFKASIADINAELKAQSKLDFATPNTKAEARAQNALLTREVEHTDVNDVERIAELNAMIDKNNQLIDANSDKLARQKINIGNYPTAFSGAFKFLNNELATIEAQLSAPGISGKEIENLALKQETLRNATALVGKEFSSTTAQQNAFKEAATQIGVVFGTDSEQFKQFNAQVKVGNSELANVKNAMSGAEVAGNKFGKALGSIWSGIRQIAYALPGVGIATLVGLLLSPLEALGTELFKYVKTSGEAGKATEDLNEKLQTQADIISETKDKFSSAASNVAELKEQVALAKQGFLDKDQVVKQYNETMGKTVGTVKDLDQVEQELVKNGDAYIQFTLLKAAAQVAYGKAAEQAFEVEQTARKKADEFRNVITDVNVTAYGSTSFNAADYDYQQKQIKAAQQKRKQEEIANEKDKEKKILDIAGDFEKQAAEIAKKFHFNFFGETDQTKLKEFIQKFFADELKDQEAAYKKISESDTVFLDTRLQARRKAYEMEFQIIEGQKNYELAVEREKLNAVINYAKSSTNEKTNARREYTNRVAEIEQKSNYDEKKAAQQLSIDLGVIRRKEIDANIALIQQEQTEIANQDKTAKDNALKNLQEESAKRQANNSQNQLDELRALDKMHEDGLISERQYQQKRFEIEKYYSLKAQSDLITDTQKLIELKKRDGDDTIDLEKKIADTKKSIDDDLTKKLIDNREKLKEKEKEVANQIINGIQQIVDNGYERQKNALQDQIDQVDVKKQKEIDAVNATTASEQDKAAKIAIINARADAQKTDLQKKQRDQDVKKAQFDKLIAILQVGIQTQQNVAALSAKAAQANAEAKLLLANPITAPYAPIAQAAAAAISAQIPLALASGAIQAGLIAAQPIPKYKTGTGFHPGGLMYAGDGGKSEIVIGPDGNVFMTPSVPTLYDMPRGTSVLPDADQIIKQSFNLMYKGVSPQEKDGYMTEMQIKLLSRKLDAVVSAISGKPVAKITNTYSGVQTSFENAYRQWEYINQSTQS